MDLPMSQGTRRGRRSFAPSPWDRSCIAWSRHLRAFWRSMSSCCCGSVGAGGKNRGANSLGKEELGTFGWVYGRYVVDVSGYTSMNHDISGCIHRMGPQTNWQWVGAKFQGLFQFSNLLSNSLQALGPKPGLGCANQPFLSGVVPSPFSEKHFTFLEVASSLWTTDNSSIWPPEKWEVTLQTLVASTFILSP